MRKKKKKINSSKYFVYFILLKEKKGFCPTDLSISIAKKIMLNTQNYNFTQINIHRVTREITINSSKTATPNAICVTHEVLLPIIEAMRLNIDVLLFNADIFVKHFVKNDDFSRPLTYAVKLNTPNEYKESCVDAWIDRNQMKLLAQSTESEKCLYNKIRKTFKSRVTQQHPFVIGDNIYYADICLKSMKVIVEVDGGYHSTPEQQAKDKKRDADFNSIGYKTIRCSNEQAKDAKFTSSLIQELLQTKKQK